ncbi:MAG TPA: hypothetical protein VNH53_06950 [Sphingomicrobium sp.]|nr:hypothetical protein [Sphingomicrobium sp.]
MSKQPPLNRLRSIAKHRSIRRSHVVRMSDDHDRLSEEDLPPDRQC